MLNIYYQHFVDFICSLAYNKVEYLNASYATGGEDVGLQTGAASR